ncbi:MAG: hypothetical protein ACYCU7_18780 [Acidimicrobiales bacterium]
MPFDSKTAKKVARDIWDKRGEEETDTEPKTAEEWEERKYLSYLAHVEEVRIEAHILTKKEFVAIIPAMVYLNSYYVEVNGSKGGRKGVPTHILEASVGADLTTIFEVSRKYMSLLWWNKRESKEEGEARWTINTHMEKPIRRYSEIAFIEIARRMGAEVRIPQEWTDICKRDYDNWKKNSPNVLMLGLPMLGDSVDEKSTGFW